MSFSPPEINDLEEMRWIEIKDKLPRNLHGTIVETVNELEDLLLENGFSGELKGMDKSQYPEFMKTLQENYVIFYMGKDYVGYFDSVCNKIIIGAPTKNPFKFREGGNASEGHKTKCGNCSRELEKIDYWRS